jgi:protein-tyrosine phosphatase
MLILHSFYVYDLCCQCRCRCLKLIFCVQAEDTIQYDITQHFREAFSYLDKVKRTGGRALVHCALGINRSAAVCLAYLMVDQKMPLLEATRVLKNKRRILLSNKAFQRQLVMFARSKNLLDNIARGSQTITLSPFATTLSADLSLLRRPLPSYKKTFHI